ncbi:MAG: YlxR family protein [Clostridiales bacterium]
MVVLKKKPERMCIICREMKDKKELIRIVRTPEGVIQVDPSGKMAGRGAYICHNADCLKKAAKGRMLEKALKVKIPAELWHTLAENCRENE